MNNSAKNTTLNVLNASAGSGKTYSLVKNYIELLLLKNASFDQFTKIMAMTFTNKAAIEMKERVLLKLEELSFPDWNNPQTSKYIDDLSQTTHLNPVEISKKCKLAFLQILHQYEDFHLLTIDKFTLKIIRSFAKELNLNSDFEIIVNDKQFFEKVIDLLVSRIGLEAHQNLTKTIISYFDLTIEDETKFNIQKDLIEFCEILTNESNISIIDEVLKREWSLQEFQTKKDERNVLTKKLSDIISLLEGEFQTVKANSDLMFGKSRSTNAIEKLIQNRENLEEFPISLTKFILGKDKGKFIPSDQFIHNLMRAQQWYENEFIQYEIVKDEIKSFYFFKLLTFIHETIEDIKSQENLIRLSEFKVMISQLLKHEVAPYIYEKIGARISHYLLDEFQDTSQLQWYNLFPLLHDAMASGNQNLIVGDAKQSIYRWRNGLAEQFVALPGIYNPQKDKDIEVVSRYFEVNGKKTNLPNNYRSAPEIVTFNNQLFEYLVTHEPKFNSPFYDGLTQIAKSTKKGYIELISEVNKIENEDASKSNVPDTHLKKILHWINELKADQFQGSDICILAKNNKQLNEISQFLIANHQAVETNESLSLKNNEYVKLTVLYLKKRFNPKNNNLSKQFIDYYLKITRVGETHLIDAYYLESSHRDAKLNESKFNIDFFESDQNFYASYASIYELVQHFYRINNWDETKDAYLHAFADFVYECENENGPNLKKIIANFEREDISLKTSPHKDSIKMMTVHKSKGLEFPAVIYYAKSKEYKGGKELFQIDNRFLYITLSEKRHKGIQEIQDFISNKKSENFIDDLNVHYVALTRPELRLYGLFYLEKELHNHICNLYQLENKESISLSIGEKTNLIQRITKEDQRLMVESAKEYLWFPDIALKEKNLDDTKDELQPDILFGIQFHLVMSLVNDKQDIIPTLQKLISTGEVSRDFKEKIEKKAFDLFEDKMFHSLFENAHQIINEQNIIISSDEVVRPDKIILKENETIVIDFKTGKEKALDMKQMTMYIKHLQEAGYPNVKGYLCYIENLTLINF